MISVCCLIVLFLIFDFLFVCLLFVWFVCCVVSVLAFFDVGLFDAGWFVVLIYCWFVWLCCAVALLRLC